MTIYQKKLDCIDTKSLNVTSGDKSATEMVRGTLHSMAGSFVRDLVDLGKLLVVWQRRASQRRHLAALEPRLLRDIGMTKEDAAHEAAKPFWKA